MKSRLTADVAETYPFRNLFDDENQAGIAAKQALDKSRDPVLTHVDDDPSAAIKPRLPRASFAAIGTAVPGATPVVFDSPFRACSGWRDTVIFWLARHKTVHFHYTPTHSSRAHDHGRR